MIEETLKISMSSLVNVLREILANMEQEQQAILEQNAPFFHSIMINRSTLINSMHDCRKSMVQEIDKLKQSHPECSEIDSEEEKLMALAQLTGVENIELLLLRDQILALMKNMEKQNMRNNILLDNRVTDATSEKERYTHQFKPVKRRVYPKKVAAQQKKPTVKILEAEELSP